MQLRLQVQQAWQRLSRRERKIARSYAKGSPDATLRVRCKIVLALVRGSKPGDVIRSGMACSSLVYSVMHRFIDQALSLDRRVGIDARRFELSNDHKPARVHNLR